MIQRPQWPLLLPWETQHFRSQVRHHKDRKRRATAWPWASPLRNHANHRQTPATWIPGQCPPSPFISQQLLIAALSRPRPFTCPNPGCTSSFERNHDLKRHVKRIHERSPRLYDCPVSGCGRVGSEGLRRRDRLKDHLKKVHDIDDVPEVGQHLGKVQ